MVFQWEGKSLYFNTSTHRIAPQAGVAYKGRWSDCGEPITYGNKRAYTVAPYELMEWSD